MTRRKVKPSILYRRGILLRVELSEREKLNEEAHAKGLSLQQHLRLQLGLGLDKKHRPPEGLAKRGLANLDPTGRLCLPADSDPLESSL